MKTRWSIQAASLTERASAQALACSVPRPRGAVERGWTSHGLVTGPSFTPTGAGAGWDTRGRVCFPGQTVFASQRAFTMIEIAIAIAVIGFALVAIIGVLPRGLEVQRDNRSETIINQDGTFWLEAIRNGARGLDELPDYVGQIDIKDDRNGNAIPPSPYMNFQSGADIIGLLTTQAANANAEVTAQVWALSGAASEKDVKATDRDLAFRYLLRVQIHRSTNSALSFLEATSLDYTNEPLATLYDLNIELSYPLVRTDRTPSRKQAFRAQISRNVITNLINNQEYYFFAP